ncbi:hypothetical protein FQR65_LT00522 [Abscondita terminalis]|nr:hypothetical protein FQR65_LT00522 [Abscondita terminalis]
MFASVAGASTKRAIVASLDTCRLQRVYEVCKMARNAEDEIFESESDDEVEEEVQRNDHKIDVKVLISEVQIRPVLWDTASELYKNKFKKRDAWKEVCQLLNPEYEQLSSATQTLFEKAIVNKWKNLRDAFVRFRKSTKLPTGSASKKRRLYIYADQLSFLSKVTTPKITETSIQNVPLVTDESAEVREETISETAVNETGEEHMSQTSIP